VIPGPKPNRFAVYFGLEEGGRAMKTGLLLASLAAALAPAVALAAAPAADGPPWNITGDDWKCVKNCINNMVGAPTRVIQKGAEFRFVNEIGSTNVAEWRENFYIAYLGCDNAAMVSADGRIITFYFGPVWAR
jgi:hypothetical protein